ncbi:hypothetical protein G6F57_022081 [Rhizopus arrhizus]|nr:hypothetical protein G6F57_022081 [Rhizopus arrhizus]
MAAGHHGFAAALGRKPLPVEAAGQQHGAQMGLRQMDLGHGQADRPGHFQIGELDALPVIGIALARKLGDPHLALLVAHDGLGARSADIPRTAQDVAVQAFRLHALVDVR